MEKILFGIMLFLILFYHDEKRLFASPDPVEVERLKSEAPLHLIGTVTSDEFYQDLTKEKDAPVQLRRMKMVVKQIVKASFREKLSEIEVYYSYIPSWREHDYVGGKRIDFAKGDIIEIWLETGKYGWEPVLAGYTVDYIQYAKNREVPIPEPLLHAFRRIVHDFFKNHTNAAVMGCLFIALFVTSFITLKRDGVKT